MASCETDFLFILYKLALQTRLLFADRCCVADFEREKSKSHQISILGRMEIETKVISMETIKPSSPTPKSLEKYQLSFLDQIAFKTFIPFVFFYTPNPNFSNSEKSKQLKKSLSEVLSIYYPLAGRLVGSLYVDCNDAGVPFSEAEADCDVSQFITSPDNEKLEKFLPNMKNYSQHLCLAVQATYFRCGVLAVAVVLSHKIADALSYIMFVNTWSAVARGGGVTLPTLDAAYAPPLPDDTILRPPAMDARAIQEEAENKIITFSASEIAALQERSYQLSNILISADITK